METQIVKAYAKINLGLKVLNKRKDDYHNLDMLMATIDLCDYIYINEINEDAIYVSSSENLGDYTNNICYKIAKKVKDTYKIEKGLKIYIQKNIPIGAGLGGGSSDAAAVLMYLNKKWNLGMNVEQMITFAYEIGSDIPFCLTKKFARVTSKGEQIKQLNIPIKGDVFIISPNFSLSTKSVFNEFKNSDKENLTISNTIKQMNKQEHNFMIVNELQKAADRLTQNKISEIIIKCKNRGLINTFMSGSGSSIVVLNKGTTETKKMLETMFPNYKIILTSLKMYTC